MVLGRVGAHAMLMDQSMRSLEFDQFRTAFHENRPVTQVTSSCAAAAAELARILQCAARTPSLTV